MGFFNNISIRNKMLLGSLATIFLFLITTAVLSLQLYNQKNLLGEAQ
jgi:hypothetical protein